MNVRIPRGVFSKLYRFKNGLKKNITYNTPRQAIALFEGDSAEVWQLIYEHDGNCQKTLEYVSRNGKFHVECILVLSNTLFPKHFLEI